MAVLPFFRVQCEGACGGWLPGEVNYPEPAEFTTFREAMQNAKESNWLHGNGAIYCGKCRWEAAT